MYINFISGGKLGDFIHCMYVVKNLCNKEGVYANIYIADGMGDVWGKGLITAYKDLYELIWVQPYVEDFKILNGSIGDGFVDLNTWRIRVANTHTQIGKYDVSWSDLLSQEYGFNIPNEYAWLKCYKKNIETQDCIVIHNSVGHQGKLPYEKIFELPCKDFLFITSNMEEWEIFRYKDRTKLYYMESVYDMADAINSCKLFVGNQSAPLALATALDIPRIADLNPDPAPFYMGEEKYSDNFMWYLDREAKYISL